MLEEVRLQATVDDCLIREKSLSQRCRAPTPDAGWPVTAAGQVTIEVLWHDVLTAL